MCLLAQEYQVYLKKKGSGDFKVNSFEFAKCLSNQALFHNLRSELVYTFK
jgi:hypothetical protein